SSTSRARTTPPACCASIRSTPTCGSGGAARLLRVEREVVDPDLVVHARRRGEVDRARLARIEGPVDGRILLRQLREWYPHEGPFLAHRECVAMAVPAAL